MGRLHPQVLSKSSWAVGGPRGRPTAIFRGWLHWSESVPARWRWRPRQIVPTSEDGGRPSRQSGPCMISAPRTLTQYLRQNQYTFMLPIEVMGPDGGLSMLLLLHHGGGRQWQQQHTVATDDDGARLSAVHALAAVAWRNQPLPSTGFM